MAFQHTDEFYAAVIRNSYNAAGFPLPSSLNDAMRVQVDLFIQSSPTYDQPEDFLAPLPGTLRMFRLLKIASVFEEGSTPLAGDNGGGSGGEETPVLKIFSISPHGVIITARSLVHTDGLVSQIEYSSSYYDELGQLGPAGDFNVPSSNGRGVHPSLPQHEIDWYEERFSSWLSQIMAWVPPVSQHLITPTQNESLGDDLSNYSSSGSSILSFGMDGNDSITGSFTDDTIIGGQGQDSLQGNNGDDFLLGDTENDALDGGHGNDWLAGEEGDDSLIGWTGDDGINGGSGNDSLLGGSGNDTLEGSEGEDYLSGYNGNDSLTGDDGADDLRGGEDADTLQGGNGNDVLYGGAGADILFGDEGNDVLHGDDGADTLNGGSGRDTLIGGAGADHFVFDDAADSVHQNADRIRGFVVGEDKIDLTGLGYTDIVVSNPEEGELRLTYNAPSNRTYILDDHSDFEFILEGDYSATLTKEDFIF